MNTTLDQWEVLQAVVQLGSFAAAADRMNRSQSTISYAISRLQEQFEVPLLEVKGRKAQLTETGKALLTEVEPLLTGFRTIEEKASALGARPEAEMRLSVDSLFPEERLFAALGQLAQMYPHVHPTLRHGAFLVPAEEFSAFRADLCITAFPARDHLTQPLLDVRLCGVAQADHPLHRGSEPLARADLFQHLAVLIEASSVPHSHQQPIMPHSGTWP
jgi:DNA-binding transcriptional LysR family regulator